MESRFPVKKENQNPIETYIFSKPVMKTGITAKIAKAGKAVCLLLLMLGCLAGSAQTPVVGIPGGNGAGVTSINGATGSFSFTGATCTTSGGTTTCTTSGGYAGVTSDSANGLSAAGKIAAGGACPSGTPVGSVCSNGANVKNTLVVSQIRNAPWDDFDVADGSLLCGAGSGHITPSGHIWNCSGTGASTAYIQHGGALSPSNTYATLQDTQPITEIEAVFSWAPQAGGVYNITDGQMTMMFALGGPSLNNLIHMQFGATGYGLSITVGGGGPGTLTSLPTPVELSGPAEAHAGSWLTPLQTDGTRYKMRMTVSGSVLTVYGPDGTVWQYTSSLISAVAWDTGMMQLGTAAAGDFQPLFNGFAIGPSKSGDAQQAASIKNSKVNAFFGNSTVVAQIARQSAKLSTTGAGWYTIATHTKNVNNHILGGTLTISGFDSAPRTMFLKIKVGAEDTTTLNTTQLSVEPYLGQWSSVPIDQIRLSIDASNNIQLDIHQLSSTAATLVVFYEGMMTPTISAVGATALATYTKTVNVWAPLTSANPLSLATTGWYTLGTQTALGGASLQGMFVINSAVSFAQQQVVVAISGNASGCTAQVLSAGKTNIFDQIRCSWDGSTGVQFDGHLNQANATVTVSAINGTSLAGMTLATAPTVGATVLAGGSNVYTVSTPFATILSGTTASIGGSALTAGTCASGTVAITNAATTNAVFVMPVTYPGDAFWWKGYVSSAGTVTVKVCTDLAAGATPTASVFNVRVTQ